MLFRLVNQANPSRTLSLVADTWYALLDLAEIYGWYPLGSFLPGSRNGMQIPEIPLFGFLGNGFGEILPGLEDDPAKDGHSFVLIEDALNLADALEHAFLDTEPVRVPSSYFYFASQAYECSLPPAIGTIQETIQFCREGSFWIVEIA